MCLGQVFKDINTATRNPPRSAIEREALHGRLKSYWVRCQYFMWNILATILLYAFTDSMLTIYIRQQRYHYNILFHTFQSISIIAYLIASFRDPGYITPIKKHQYQSDCINIEISKVPIEQEEDYKYLDMNTDFVITHIKTGDNADKQKSMDVLNGTFPYEIVRYVPEYNRHIIIDPNSAPSDFCWRCRFIRPIRSKHCYDCDRCVAKFDHHCPMVGNCVAGKNHRFFVLFMCSQTVVVLWAFYLSLNSLFEMDYYMLNSAKKTSDRNAIGWCLRIFLFVALFFAVFVTVGLSGYHLYLAVTNQTTYEMIKPQIVESYIKDEMKRKKKYIKRMERRRMKQLKKEKAKEMKREKELKRQRMELQQKIDVLEDDIEHKDDEKYIDKDPSESDDESEEDTISSDDTSSSEKVLLFDKKEKHDSSAGKRMGTPGPQSVRKKAKARKRRKRWSNYTDEYINYFDEGLIGNLYIFMKGKIHPEWRTPLPCTVVKRRAAR